MATNAVNAALAAAAALAASVAILESSKYNEKDAAKDTGVSQKEVAKAWHRAREQVMAGGELPERQG